MKTTDERIPTVGEYVVERNGSFVGTVVDVAIKGDDCVVANEWEERVFRFSAIKGLFLGRRVVPSI